MSFLDKMAEGDSCAAEIRRDPSAEVYEMPCRVQPCPAKLDRMELAHDRVRAAHVGSVVTCPTCGHRFTKRSYQHVFCRSVGPGNCKDRYWNLVDPERCARVNFFIGGVG